MTSGVKMSTTSTYPSSTQVLAPSTSTSTSTEGSQQSEYEYLYPCTRLTALLVTIDDGAESSRTPNTQQIGCVPSRVTLRRASKVRGGRRRGVRSEGTAGMTMLQR